MSYSENLLPEFDQEMANTRKILELVPDDKLDWQAHPKLRTIGWNANHLAEIPGWVEGSLSQTAWDIAPVDGPRYESPKLTTREEIIQLFDRNVAAARQAMAAASDDDWRADWSLLQGGQTIMTTPRLDVLRTWVINHTIHHRAHLSVYLRLNDITVPGMYGPGGD